jgi:hypothetical protein
MQLNLSKRLLAFTSIAFLVPAVFLGLLRPFNSDESIFMYGGMLLNNGQKPYEQLWDHKGPLLYVLNSIGLNLGFPNSAGVPFLQAFLIFLVFVYILCSREPNSSFVPRTQFQYFFVTISAFSIYLSLSSFGTTELWTLPMQLFIYFLTLGLFFGPESKDSIFISSRVFYIYGFTLGAIFLVRPNNGFGVTLCTILALVRFSSKLRKSLLFLTFGLISSVAITAVFYFPLSPQLIHAMFEQFFTYSYDYSNGYNVLQKTYGSIYLFINFAKLPLVFLLICLIIMKSKYLKMTEARFGLVLLSLDFVSQLTSGRGYSTYLMATFAASLTLIYIFMVESNLTPTEFKASMVASVLIFSLSISTSDFEARWHKGFREQRIATQYLITHISPTDEILYLGNNPYIFVRSKRLSISPIIYNYPLLSKFYRGQSELVDSYSKLIIDSPPNYVIQDAISSCSLKTEFCYAGDSQYYAENLSLGLLRSFLKDNYTKEIEISNLIFYRLIKKSIP